MDIKKLIERIVRRRNQKGFTYENMAEELDITPAAYRKIETGETKLSVERLIRISEILEEDLCNFLDAQNCSENKNRETNNNYTALMESIKDTYEKLVQSKDEQIALLREQITLLKK
jgi:Helix-turn-helix.